MKMNKKEFEARLEGLMPAPCRKLAMDNIVFPMWSELGAFAFMHRFDVYTAEQPNGCSYDAAKFQSVLRVLGGKVLFDDFRRSAHNHKRTDNYCWGVEKVVKLVSDGKTRPIGTASAEGLLNLMELSATITDEDDRLAIARTFASFNRDMLLAHTPAENRYFVRINESAYNAGWKYCVDEWMDVDQNGNAEATELLVGDVLIINTKADGSRTCYRIDREMFELTHEY